MYVTHTVIISINDPTTSEKSITAKTVGKVSVSLAHLVIKLYASQKHVFDRQKDAPTAVCIVFLTLI